jgi:hypothetical protein
MTKLPDPRTDKVFRELAASGRYVNTGKVLIGVSHVPRPMDMSQDAELFQGVFLGTHRPRYSVVSVAYVVVLAFVFGILVISSAT